MHLKYSNITAVDPVHVARRKLSDQIIDVVWGIIVYRNYNLINL